MPRKKIAREIFNDALEASKAHKFMQAVRLENETLKIFEDSYDLSRYKNIYIFGSGKAAESMACEIEKILGDKIHKGIVVTSQKKNELKFIKVLEGTHPLPTQKSLDAAQELIDAMNSCENEDLFIYLLSGGSSAIIELPIDSVSLQDLQETTRLMLHNALDIHEMNVIRKHLSQVKGGRLVEKVQADGIILVLSDIVDNDLYSIGSAPTYCDRSTFEEALDILEAKEIFEKIPLSVQNVLKAGKAGQILETPKEVKSSLKHYVVASNMQALQAAKKSASVKGLDVELIDIPLDDTVENVVEEIYSKIVSSSAQCILFGGECTVKVQGNGKGGRNQHLVALLMQKMDETKLDVCFLSAATDGIDGNSDAAGACVDYRDFESIHFSDLHQSIVDFDTNSFFDQNGFLIHTGATGTNVIDLVIIIKDK